MIGTKLTWNRTRWTTYQINPNYKELFDGVSNEVSNEVSNGVSNGVSNSDNTTLDILYLIQKNPFISRREIAAIKGIALKTVQKHINKLKYQGIIRRSGPITRGGRWEIIK